MGKYMKLMKGVPTCGRNVFVNESEPTFTSPKLIIFSHYRFLYSYYLTFPKESA